MVIYPMDFTETIDGAGIQTLFEELEKDKTLIKLKIDKIDFESLTLLTGFRRKFGRNYFLLDYPEGFREATAKMKSWRLKFEFTGRDKIQHSFTAIGSDYYRDQLCIDFPKKILRLQRRKNFRLEAPDGSIIDFKIDETRCKEKVIDVSLGGALVSLVCFGDASLEDLPFQPGDMLEEIELVFPGEYEEQRIYIEKATVVRIQDGRQDARICCGLQFRKIDKSQIEALTDFIYNYQRRYLRTRLRPDM